MLMTFDQARAKIESGKPVHIAGDERVLSGLPRGNWIGGTIPYFMTSDGGKFSLDHVFVRELTPEVSSFTIQTYDVKNLHKLVSDAPENGFSIIILPGFSEIHSTYAKTAPDIDGLFTKPIVGWIAGIDLAELGKMTPKVFNGHTGETSDNVAVVMHAALPDTMFAEVGIINLFDQGAGEVLTFEQDGFVVTDCLVNGKKTNLAKYLVEKRIDTKLPLVADYHGEKINVSFQKVNSDIGTVDLYAPVFRNVEYRMARPVSDYMGQFFQTIPAEVARPDFCCNCILNYLYSDLEGKKTGEFTGPITFGEVAYQLLNQTMVYLNIKSVTANTGSKAA